MKPARSPKEIEQIRNTILDRALDIIVDQGLDNLTMRNLAGRVKMTAPNIYNYYAGKDEIYLSLVVQGFEMLQAVMEDARRGPGDMKARARAMVEAYLKFGIEQCRYYDIMFVLPTPKHNDYKGTPHERLSEMELRVSMGIADMARQTLLELYGDAFDEETVTRRLIQIWGLLHGMISLYNSRVVQYVADDILSVYRRTIDELIDMIDPS